MKYEIREDSGARPSKRTPSKKPWIKRRIGPLMAPTTNG